MNATPPRSSAVTQHPRSYMGWLVPVLLLLLCFGLGACQSTPFRDFDELKVGVDKATVLAVAGSPTVTRRMQGQDRWVYTHGSTIPEVREVHFLDGKATYIGPEYKPAVSAEEQDRRNDEANQQAAKIQAEERLERDKELGISRRKPAPTALDANDRRLQESFYGTVDPSAERNKIAPTFEVIK